MQLEARKYLHDIQQAAALIARFTAGRGFEDYAGDAMRRAAVEREFEIVGALRAVVLRPRYLPGADVQEPRRTD